MGESGGVPSLLCPVQGVYGIFGTIHPLGDRSEGTFLDFLGFAVFLNFPCRFRCQNLLHDVPGASGIDFALINAQSGSMTSGSDQFSCFWDKFWDPSWAQAGPGPGPFFFRCSLILSN